MDQIKIGTFISQQRKAKELTQEQLAERVGVTQKSVSRWETGKNMPDISLLQPISEELDISVTELLKGEKSIVPIERQTTEAVSQLLDYSSLTQKAQFFNREDINFITWVFLLFGTILLIIGALINHETIPLLVVGIISIIVIFRILFGKCQGCKKIIPLTIKTPKSCPYCGLVFYMERRK